MKALSLLIVLLAASAVTDVASASGGLAVVRVRQPLFRPRVVVQRQQLVAPVVVRQRAAFVQPYAVQQFVAPVYAAPLIVQPQAYVVPQVQQYVVPQVQAFAVPQCSSSAFFAY